MTDYKDKYLRAVKALDEAEREGNDNAQDLYRVFISIIAEMKGQHRQIDKAIKALPKALADNTSPPIDELTNLKDLIISYFNKADAVGMAPEVLDVLLSALQVSDELHEGVDELQADLQQAATLKDYTNLVKQLASLVLKNTARQADQPASSSSISEVKQSLLQQLERLAESDIELAKNIDYVGLIKELKKVASLNDLEYFYQKMLEGLAQRISKKDEFIVELSGLIETVVHRLSELSSDLKRESTNNREAHKDRWRLTELMGGQIDTIQKSVLETDSLQTLKSMLSNRLGELNQTVVDFSELESKRALQAEEHVERISMQLNEMESEVLGLKSSLHQAHQQAFVDALTGIGNRRAYDERIDIEFERWKRNKESLVLAILDVDHFKNINDTFGHPVGDKVLRTICQLIDKKVRDSDFFGRIGGEEFAIIFAGSDLDNAIKRLNQFRASIEACKFGSKGKRIVITLSAGCATFSAEDDPDLVYERADRALLKAKQTGRNKCLSELEL